MQDHTLCSTGQTRRKVSKVKIQGHAHLTPVVVDAKVKVKEEKQTTKGQNSKSSCAMFMVKVEEIVARCETKGQNARSCSVDTW
jgi:hypothetical protein